MIKIFVKQVSFTNILQTVSKDQELLLKVYTINVAPEQDQGKKISR